MLSGTPLPSALPKPPSPVYMYTPLPTTSQTYPLPVRGSFPPPTHGGASVGPNTWRNRSPWPWPPVALGAAQGGRAGRWGARRAGGGRGRTPPGRAGGSHPTPGHQVSVTAHMCRRAQRAHKPTISCQGFAFRPLHILSELSE